MTVLDERIGLAVAAACRTSPELDPVVAAEAIETAARSSFAATSRRRGGSAQRASRG
ncbi:MAG: hypothetical protein ABSG36_08780 [Acidimicrobiales bacterium]